MKKTDSVFQLIKSLTRGEKRNFRMLAQLTSGDKKYLQLFDVMDSMDDYDEDKILRKFRKDPAFEKQFAYNKNYLYNNILNALAYFHKGQDSELSSLTLQVRILLEKNLYFQAKRMIRKVKDKVRALEKFEELLTLLQFETEVIRRTEDMKVMRDAFREVEIEEQITLTKISNLQKYRRLESRVFLLMKEQYYSREKQENVLYQEVMTSEVMEAETEAQSLRAKILYNVIKMRINTYEGDEAAALGFCDRAISLMESNKELLDNEAGVFLGLLNFSARSKFMTLGFEPAYQTLIKIKAVKIRTAHHRSRRFILYHASLLALHNDVGRELPKEEIEEIFKESRALNNDLAASHRMWVYYEASKYYLIHGNPSEALRWMNEFLNNPRNPVRKDLQAMARLVNLFIHFELGNYDLIEYKLKSTYRFIYKQEILHGYERRILSFFRKAINLTEKEELMEELQLFRDDLDEVFKNPKERIATNYFHIYAWIDAKLNGYSYSQSLKVYAEKGWKAYEPR